MSVVMLAGSCSAVGAEPVNKSKSSGNAIVRYIKNHKKTIAGALGVAATGLALYLINSSNEELLLDARDIEYGRYDEKSWIKELKDSISKLRNPGDSLLVSNFEFKYFCGEMAEYWSELGIDKLKEIKELEKNLSGKQCKISGHLELKKNKDGRFNLEYRPLQIYSECVKFFETVVRMAKKLPEEGINCFNSGPILAELSDAFGWNGDTDKAIFEVVGNKYPDIYEQVTEFCKEGREYFREKECSEGRKEEHMNCQVEICKKLAEICKEKYSAE